MLGVFILRLCCIIVGGYILSIGDGLVDDAMTFFPAFAGIMLVFLGVNLFVFGLLPFKYMYRQALKKSLKRSQDGT